MLARAAELEAITNELQEIQATENWQSSPEAWHRVYELKAQGETVMARAQVARDRHNQAAQTAALQSIAASLSYPPPVNVYVQ